MAKVRFKSSLFKVQRFAEIKMIAVCMPKTVNHQAIKEGIPREEVIKQAQA